MGLCSTGSQVWFARLVGQGYTAPGFLPSLAMKPPNVVAERLHLLRKRMGLTQAELGQRVGVSQASISSWERGEFAPTVTDLSKIADAAEVSLDWLAGRSDSTSGLSPGMWIIDLAQLDNPTEELWCIEVPRRHRIVDHREKERLKAEVRRRKT
jgi:transcriptional regulator with XRE-family HTH domain